MRASRGCLTFSKFTSTPRLCRPGPNPSPAVTAVRVALLTRRLPWLLGSSTALLASYHIRQPAAPCESSSPSLTLHHDCSELLRAVEGEDHTYTVSHGPGSWRSRLWRLLCWESWLGWLAPFGLELAGLTDSTPYAVVCLLGWLGSCVLSVLWNVGWAYSQHNLMYFTDLYRWSSRKPS